MMKNDPAEVYRILTEPDYSMKSINLKSEMRKTEWSEQHEDIFTKLSKRTYTASSLAKSMTFQDLKKSLPKNLDYPDKNWKYDRNSPWVLDLDHNPNKPWVQMADTKVDRQADINIATEKIKALSNINVRQDISENCNSDSEELRADLAAKIGKVDKMNKIRLEKLTKKHGKLDDFRDSVKGFNML